MCAKQLYVKSNGQWVAAGGAGGSVDTAGLATEQFVTDAIAAIPATDLSGLATLTDLNDALATIPESAITLHDGAAPQPAAPVPQALEDAFADYEDGLHFFKGAGALVTLIRQPYQTTIVINGPVKSVAKIVKSEAGLPTPENPSLLVQQESDGKWMKLASDKIDKPFGPPQMVDIFALTGGTVDLSDYYTKPEADDRYAQKVDNTQNFVANAVLAKGYAFGDAVGPNNPGLVYTDTGEGYGPRLVLDTPAGVELIPYQSDFEPIKERLTTLESKTAPTVDLSPYITQVDADARYGARTAEAVSLLQGQLQSVFDSVYTRPEADDRYAERAKTYTKTECDGKFLTLVDIDQFAYRADVYTQKQTDDRFMRIDQAFSKADFDNQMALLLYSRKQVDDKLAAISPLGSPSINNPALAEFKKSVLDEVKLMLVGGTKMPPPDIDWTWMVRMDGARESVSTEIQARMIGGFIELKGTLSFGAGSGAWVPLRLPPQFPLAELEASYPLAMRLVGSAVTYGYCSVSNKNRDISCSPGARSSEATFSGIRWKAAY
jgi:hypothetical protein